MKFSLNSIQKKIFYFLLLLLVLGTGLLLWKYSSQRESQKDRSGWRSVFAEDEIIRQSSRKPDVARLKVYVCGEVKKTGIYSFYQGSRVVDAIMAAGGSTDNADLRRVDMAKRLRDGMTVKVPPKKAVKFGRGDLSDGSKNTRPARRGNVLGNGERININTATAVELERIPGIGTIMARKIIEYRNLHGSFSSPDDLKELPGISEKKWQMMKEHIEI